MNYEQEIQDLKAQVARLSSENDDLRSSIRQIKVMVDVFEQSFLDLAIDVTHAHEKANCLLYQNPGIVADMAELEKIVGPLDNPTPDAPANS